MRQTIPTDVPVAGVVSGQLPTRLPAVLSGHPGGFEDVDVDVEVAAIHGGGPELPAAGPAARSAAAVLCDSAVIQFGGCPGRC